MFVAHIHGQSTAAFYIKVHAGYNTGTWTQAHGVLM